MGYNEQSRIDLYMYGVNIYLAIKTVIKGRYDNTFYSSMGEWCVRVMR